MAKYKGYKDHFGNMSKQFDRVNRMNPEEVTKPLTLKEQIERENKKVKMVIPKEEEDRFIQDSPNFVRNLPFVK